MNRETDLGERRRGVSINEKLNEEALSAVSNMTGIQVVSSNSSSASIAAQQSMANGGIAFHALQMVQRSPPLLTRCGLDLVERLEIRHPSKATETPDGVAAVSVTFEDTAAPLNERRLYRLPLISLRGTEDAKKRVEVAGVKSHPDLNGRRGYKTGVSYCAINTFFQHQSPNAKW